MYKPTSRVWAFITTVVLALAGVVALNLPAPSAKALSGSMFDPGLIIGDSVFYDFGTMDADGIQGFLDQQVPHCKLAPATKPGDFSCLRFYRTDIPAMAASAGRCDAIDAQSNVLASKMIEIIARACNINPRVILVTLQKEQGLVTSTNPYWPDSKNPSQPSTTRPLDYRYQIAMGFACPDTGPCTTFGFFYQVYKAASQFHWYGNPQGSFTYLKVGKNVTIHYQVASVAGCGTKTFLLKSQATAALYYYTPYTPNAAALGNLYGSGDKCSAYGNRNFWRYYWDWFGSPIGGGFLLQSATSAPYLIVPNTVSGGFSKYRVSDNALATALAPLGPIGTVSQDYLDTFPDAGEMSRLIKSATGNYYLVDNGAKFPFSSCAQVSNFGLDCANAVQLTSYQLNALATGSAISALVPQDPTVAGSPQYLIAAGVKHEILDSASVTAAGITLPDLAGVGIGAFANLPWGTPIAKEGTLFKNRTDGSVAILSGGKYYEFDSGTSADLNLKAWFPMSSGTLSTDGLSALPTATLRSIVADEAGAQFVLTSAGKLPVTQGTAISASATPIPAALLAKIPSAGSALTAPFLAKPVGGKTVYWITQTGKRAVVSAKSATRLTALATVPTVQALPPSAMNLLLSSSPIVAPGTLVQTGSGKQVLIDGFGYYATVANADWAKEYGLVAPAEKISSSLLAGYSSEGSLGIKVLCGGVQYLPIGGYWQPIDAAYSAAYPGIPLVLDANTCGTLRFGKTQLGRFVTSPAKLTYLIAGGKRRLVSAKQYALIRGTTPAAFKIDMTMALALPLGTPMAASYKTVLTNPNDLPSPSPTPTPTVTPSVKPTVTPSPSVSPKPSPSPSVTPTVTPTPTPTTRTYTVVSGDTLTTIAKKFAVTVTALKSANGLTTDLIKVGQKLLIP